MTSGAQPSVPSQLREQADAGIRRLLGVELRRRQRAVLDGREERLAVLGPGQPRLRERRLHVEQPLLRGERVHEVEALVLDAVEEHASPRRASTVFQPMCGSTRRVELGDDARPLAEALGVDAALDAALEQHLHARRRCRAPGGRPASRRSMISSPRTARSASITARERADARARRARRPRATAARSAVSSHLGAGALERLDGRVDVARAVVEHARRVGRAGHRAPFVRGTPVDQRVERLRLAERARERLELRLGDVVRVAAGEHGHVHGEPGVEGDRLEDVAHQRTGEVAADEVVLEAGRLAGVHEVRAARDVDDGLRERLVERHERVAVARDAAPCRRAPRGSPGRARSPTSSTVWCASMSVSPRRAHGEIGERVLRERGEQVVEERHRGVDVADARCRRGRVDSSMLDSLVSRCTRAVRGALAAVMPHPIAARPESSRRRSVASRNAVVSASVPAVTRR